MCRFYVHDKIIGYKIVANDFDPEYKRKTFIKESCNKFKTPKPQIHTVHLEAHQNTDNHENPWLHRDCVEVVCFDFVNQFMDLMSDFKLFGNLDNILVNKNPNNPDEKLLPCVNNNIT
jgi:hypothetical protein